MRKVHNIQPEPGGYLVTIEVENAYTDGSSRFDQVHLPYSDVDGKSDEEILIAINERRSVARLRGRSIG